MPIGLCPAMSISSKAMSIVNSFVNDMLERVAAEASRLAHYNNCSTKTYRKVHTYVRLLLPSELVKHAVSDGTKAVPKYTSSKWSEHPTIPVRFVCVLLNKKEKQDRWT